MFRELRVNIDIARSTDGALSKAIDDDYDVAFSDMARDGEQTAGLTFLKMFRNFDIMTPVIFYVGTFNIA